MKDFIIMRKLSLSIFLLVFAFAACDVLDHQPQTSVSETVAIHNLASAEAALNGLYDQLQSNDYYGDNLQILSDVSSDITQSYGTWDFYREADIYRINKGNDESRRLYTQMYSVINHANNLIADVPGLDDVSQADKDRILGESHFVRALAYFDLTRTYGGIIGRSGTLGVPLVLTPSREINDDSFPSRSTLAESWAQIFSDLTEAKNRLNGNGFSHPGHVSEAAVEALLSRYYLYMEDYDNTETYATNVIDNYNFILTPVYADIFNKQNTSGSIFEIQYTTTDGNSIRFWHYPSNDGGRQDIVFHDEYALMILARSDDSRGDLIAYDPPPAGKPKGVYYPAKYNRAGGDNNIQVLRLAEMYLNRAEARAKKTPADLPGAVSDLNVIRNRAGLADTLDTGSPTAEDILLAIEKERGIEFVLENHRWYDLIRTGRAMTVLSGIIRHNGETVTLDDPNRFVFPIPERDMDANPNLDGQQNEAYK